MALSLPSSALRREDLPDVGLSRPGRGSAPRGAPAFGVPVEDAPNGGERATAQAGAQGLVGRRFLLASSGRSSVKSIKGFDPGLNFEIDSRQLSIFAGEISPKMPVCKEQALLGAGPDDFRSRLRPAKDRCAR